MDGVGEAERAIRRWFAAALEVVDPRDAVRSALQLHDHALIVNGEPVPLSPGNSVIVLAVGKAACGLARGAHDVLGARIDRGLILTKYGHVQDPVEGFEVFEANHPTPDQAGLDATARILTIVEGLTADDLVIALISGGGSSLLELPREGIGLGDMQEVTRLLMHAGAGINDLNTVRKVLSEVKGGGLRARIGPAQCVTLLLSDVLGNDPSVIASGPTVPSATGPSEAREVVRRFGVEDQLPGRVIDVLESLEQEQLEVDTSHDVIAVIADNAMLVDEVASAARCEGLRVHVDDAPYDGDAAQLGRGMVSTLVEISPDIEVYVRGGEATVAVTGDGVGGRNTEMALAAALALDGSDEWVIASLASDGDDGNSGAAGAIADGGTVGRARAAGVDPVDALRRNDSATVIRATGGLVETGPTGTNVNDVYLAVRIRQDSEEGTRR
jgi:glycerate-2-kinase